jgi:hypothetical protein
VGGDLDVEDTPGGGCTMVVRLSRVVGDLAPAPHSAEPDPAADTNPDPEPSGRGQGPGLTPATDSTAPAP